MSDWNVAMVSDLVREGILFVEDGNHGEQRPLQHEFVATGIPFVRPPDLMDGRVLYEQCDRINDDARRRVRKGIGRGGDILFTHRATVGRMALTEPGDPEFVANPGVTIWRCQNENIIDRHYLYHWMHTPEFMNQVWAVASGADTFPYISLSEQRKLRISWPSVEKQRSIATVLQPIDQRMRLNHLVNETLEGMAQAIFRDWFIDFGPVRRKQAGATDPIEIMGGLTFDSIVAVELAALFPGSLSDDELPVGWMPRAIGDVVEISGGSTPSTGNEALWQPAVHRWATPKDLSGMSDLALFETGRRISDAGLAGITSGLLPAGTVLLSSRAPIGYLAITQEPVAINQGFIALKPTKDVGSAYLYLWCKANMDAIVANANGSTFQEISKKNFRPITSALPADSAIIATFGNVAEPLVDRIVCAAAENRTLAEARDYLLPRLMSGAVRVGEAAQIIDAVEGGRRQGLGPLSSPGRRVSTDATA